jgi:dimethylamine monooxygenase subunit A
MIFQINPNKFSEPPKYFPITKGEYSTAPGLRELGIEKVFEIDNQFQLYRDAKLESRRENLDRHIKTKAYDTGVSQAVVEFISEKLVEEYPEVFTIEGKDDPNLRILECRTTGEILYLGKDEISWGHDAKTKPEYESRLDALACQIQEDITVMTANEDYTKNWLSAVHVCSPNYWAPDASLGKSFSELHGPVPDSKKQLVDGLLKTSIKGGPFTRFVWGLTEDKELNHYYNSETDEKKWTSFSPENPELYLRVEREVLWGLKHVRALVFSFRTYFTPIQEIKSNAEHSEQLSLALQGMTPPERAYKRLTNETIDDIMKYLED